MSVTSERIAACVLGLAAGAVFSGIHGLSASTVGQGVLVACAGFSIVEMRRLRELGSSDHRKHGRATAWWHLAVTNFFSVAYAWFMFDGYRHGGDEAFKAFGSAAKDWMLGSGLVGGNIGLFRSTGTASASLAALRQNDSLHAEVLGLRRQLGDVSDLSTTALDASQATTIEEVLERLASMVTKASDLPEKSELVDAFTVWVGDPSKRSWRILSGRGISAASLAIFSQPMLDAEREGAGLVANMAVTRTTSLIVASNAKKHRWYAPDSDSKRNTEGMAAVLIHGKNGEPCGALCLTTEDASALPSPANEADLRRLEKVLLLWAGTFTLPIQRYFELIERS